MADLLPGAVLDPGAHWNGEAGWLTPSAVIWHFTVGVDSRSIGRAGYFAFLIARDGTVFQFAPSNAVCFHACEWNRATQGIEVESLDGSITQEQIGALGYVTQYLLATYGIPAVFYDGERLPVGFPLVGVTNHRALHENACDEHYDGFDQWVWDAAMHPAPLPPPAPDLRLIAAAQEDDMGFFPPAKTDDGVRWTVGVGDGKDVYVDRWRRDGTHIGRDSLGGATNDRPSIIADGQTVTVFVRGFNRGEYARTWNGSAWGAWQDAGGAFVNPITTS